MTSHSQRLLLSLLLAAASRSATAARPQLVAAFEDDASDATGPGSYQPPGDSEIMDGDFDLRRFEVWLDGDDVLFKATMGAPFRQPGVTARTTATPVPLWNNIYLQNIDIYIDTDRYSEAGYSVCVPGRRVSFAGGRTWKAAVVMTPQPGAALGITEEALGEAGKHVLFPKNLQVNGRTVTARVPAAALGGPPRRSWGYSVHVSGARWERTFSLVDRMVHGKPQADAFTMPVLGVAEAWAFGGAPGGSAYPRVVDVLLPRGADQKAILGSFNEETGAFARVPFVDLERVPPPATPPMASPPPHPDQPTTKPAATAAPSGLKVVDFADGTVSIGGPVDGIRPMMIGRVLDATGATLARVLVLRLFDGGLVATTLDGADKIKRGAPVHFDAQGEGR